MHNTRRGKLQETRKLTRNGRTRASQFGAYLLPIASKSSRLRQSNASLWRDRVNGDFSGELCLPRFRIPHAEQGRAQFGMQPRGICALPRKAGKNCRCILVVAAQQRSFGRKLLAENTLAKFRAGSSWQFIRNLNVRQTQLVPRLRQGRGAVRLFRILKSRILE